MPFTLMRCLMRSRPALCGEADDRRLRGAIDGDQRFSSASGLRGEVDDLASATLLDHLLRDRLEGEQQTLDIHRIDTTVAFASDFDDGSEVENPRVVDENVDAAELGNRGDHHGVDRSLICDVELETDGVGSQRRCDGFGALFVQIGDDDLCAFLHVAFRDRLADAASGACDDGDLVVQFHDDFLLLDWTNGPGPTLRSRRAAVAL